MAHSNRRLVAFAAFTLAVVAVVSGCATSNGATQGVATSTTKLKIGAVYLDTQGFYAGVKKGVQLGAQAAGKEVDFVETNAAADASKESTFVDTLISSKADAILLSAVSVDADRKSVV